MGLTLLRTSGDLRDGHFNCGDCETLRWNPKGISTPNNSGSLRNMQRKAGFGLGVRKLFGVMAGSREAWALARPSTSCETLRKSFSVSGPQAFLPVK